MKLHYTTVSPYVRKATVTAIEAGVDSGIERVEPSVSVWVGEGDPDVALDNPIGKVPTLVTHVCPVKRKTSVFIGLGEKVAWCVRS